MLTQSVIAATIMSVVMSASARMLNEYPFLMAHDAGSGYLDRTHVVADWTKTQSVGLAGQLQCGARAFDYRPYYEDGTLFVHHGGVVIHTPMQQSLDEITTWASSNPENELVLIFLTACDGDDGCKDAAISLTEDNGIKVITDCSQLTGLTYEDALSMSSLTGGGNALAVYDCMESHYDSTINCYGKGYACYNNTWFTETTGPPWEQMTEYALATSAEPPPSNGNLWMIQTHWQSDAASITLGTLHKSSLLIDEEKSMINAWTAEQIELGAFKYMNMVEVDNVCDAGPRILNALRNSALS